MAGRRISSLPAVGMLSAGAMVEVVQDGASFRAPVAKIARKRLTAAATFYVRTNGNDDNDGLSNDAGGAKRTHQGAIDMLMRDYDLNGYSVTIETDNNGASSYPGFDVVGRFVGCNGRNIVHIRGNPAAPATVVVTGTSDDALYLEDARVKVSGITFKTLTGGRGWLCRRHSYLEHADCRFDDCANETILTTEGAVVAASGPLEVAGDSTGFIHATGNSRISFEGVTVTFTGNPVFTPYVIGINTAWVSFASGTVVGDKQGQTLVHISGILNLSSMTGKLYGTNSAPVVEAGGMIIPPDTHSTVYVRSDGSDNNDGYYNTAAGAFRTIAAAIEFLAKRPYDPHNTRVCTIQVGAGTWTVPVVLKDIPNADSVTIQGDLSTPANVVINVSGNAFTSSFLKTVWTVQGFRVVASGAGLQAVGGSRILFRSIEFGACATHIVIGRNALIEAVNNYSIIGNATYHVFATRGSVSIASITVTLTGTPAFSGVFAFLEGGSYGRLGATWSGSATGARYDLRSNSVIDVNGAGTSSLPGNAAGSSSSGGQYV